MAGKGPRTSVEWYITFRNEWYSGMSYSEIARKHGKKPSTVSYYMKHYAPPGVYPHKRPAELDRKAKSRGVRRHYRSVDPSLIMELIDEYCEEHDLTFNAFCERVMKLPRWKICYMHEVHNGTRRSISGRMAADLMRAIGEPVPDYLTRPA